MSMIRTSSRRCRAPRRAPAPTRPQPTITTALHAGCSSGIGLANDPDLARGVLQNVGDGAPDGEVAAEARAERQADDEQVGVALGRLVDERRPDLARLEQHRLERVAGRPRRWPRRCPGCAARPRTARDVGVERHRPVDLDDVDADQLGLGRAGELGGERDDGPVGPGTGQRHDGAPELWCRRVGHGRWSLRVLGGPGRAIGSRPARAAARRHDTTERARDSVGGPTGRRRPGSAAGVGVLVGPDAGAGRGPGPGVDGPPGRRRRGARRAAGLVVAHAEPGRARRGGTARRRPPCAAGRAGSTAAGAPTGCRGSAPTSAGDVLGDHDERDRVGLAGRPGAVEDVEVGDERARRARGTGTRR